MPHSTPSKPSVTSDWPPNYRALFWSDWLLSYQVAVILALLGVVKSSRNFLLTVGAVAVAIGLGVLIGATIEFQTGWIYFATIPLLIEVVGAISAVISSPHRTSLYDRYRPGTEARIVVSDGRIAFSLNGHLIGHRVDEVRAVWCFGSLSAVEFVNKKFDVIPTRLVPHWSDPAKRSRRKTRWGPPASQ